VHGGVFPDGLCDEPGGEAVGVGPVCEVVDPGVEGVEVAGCEVASHAAEDPDPHLGLVQGLGGYELLDDLDGFLEVSLDSGVVLLGEFLLLGGCEAVGLDGLLEVLFDSVCVVGVPHPVEVGSDLGHDLMAHLGVGLLSVEWGYTPFVRGPTVSLSVFSGFGPRSGVDLLRFLTGMGLGRSVFQVPFVVWSVFHRRMV
jgi:hypothetical protein